MLASTCVTINTSRTCMSENIRIITICAGPQIRIVQRKTTTRKKNDINSVRA